MDDIVKEFLIESHENLDRLDSEFVALEKNPDDKELLSSIFRTIHTIKGTCGFLDFPKLEKLTHAGETLLSRLRDGHLRLNNTITSVLLELIDAVRTILGQIEVTGLDGNEDYSLIINKLDQCTGSRRVIKNKPKKTNSDSAIEMIAPDLPIEAVIADSIDDSLDIENAHPQSAQDTSIRIHVDLLDKLMNLVGELVLARNQIVQYSQHIKEADFIASTQRLSTITSELQNKVMKTRLQPISTIWSKFPRLVRDLAASLNKEVNLRMEGEETEIDRSLIEAIKDPLTHILRNAIDHGIEQPAIRQERGKRKEGTISLAAYHEGGQVIIEISDDGNGIDIEGVKIKAMNLGWFNKNQLDLMPDQQLYNLILMPGFSTAAEVTAISGRGVGMDVVKTQVEKIGGRLDIQSTFKEGLNLKIKIPLTLSIIPALIIDCEAGRYAIPQVNLVELLLINNEDNKKVEWIYNLPVYRLRGQLLPLVRLADLLAENVIEPMPEKLQKNLSVIVLKAGEKQFGLLVDNILDNHEIVVKALTKKLKNLGVYLGATILGNGQIVLILDAMGIAQRAGMLSNEKKKINLNPLQEREPVKPKQKYLLVQIAANQIGIPLEAVTRLEQISKKTIEISGGNPVIQYQDGIMPLINMSALLFNQNEKSTNDEDKQLIVVIAQGKEHLGFIVEQIVDTVEEDLPYHELFSRDMVLGSGVIKGKVTEIIDVERIIQRFSEKVGPKSAGKLV